MKVEIGVAATSRGRTRKFKIARVVEVFAGPAYIAIVTKNREFRVRLNHKGKGYRGLRTVRILPG